MAFVMHDGKTQSLFLQYGPEKVHLSFANC